MTHSSVPSRNRDERERLLLSVSKERDKEQNGRAHRFSQEQDREQNGFRSALGTKRSDGEPQKLAPSKRSRLAQIFCSAPELGQQPGSESCVGAGNRHCEA
jgi:hypothetical protein